MHIHPDLFDVSSDDRKLEVESVILITIDTVTMKAETYTDWLRIRTFIINIHLE